ncbi:dimethylaniline monooxygenase (N-oxide forming) [biofilm metagenome]
MATKVIDKIAVIGAGVAGLGAARILTQAGFECEIFEKGAQVGGQWSAGYHTFGLQTPKSLYEIPDYPIPDAYPRVPSGAELQAYFENYAKDFKLFDKIRFNTEIIRLERVKNGSWKVHFKDSAGKQEGKEFDFVVVASGIYFDPYIPDIPGKDKFKGEILHSSQYRTPATVTGRKVAVVGFGKSALDVAGDAAKFAKQVTLVFRKAHWPIPMDILEVLDVRRIYLTRLACALLPLYQRPQGWVNALHTYLPWLVKGFWRFTEAVIKFQYPLKACGILPDEAIEIDIFNLDILPRKEVYQLMSQGMIHNRQCQIKEFTATGIQLESGEVIDCDTVIFGTGYQSNYAFLPEAFKKSNEADGVYLYRHILHPDLPNMAFIGRAATFSNGLTAHLASVWLVNLLKGKFQLPSREQMLVEIQAIKDWKRGFMPAISSRATVIKLHMVHYHDELLNDFGVNPYRKKNVFAEWLTDYRPADYKDVLADVARVSD